MVIYLKPVRNDACRAIREDLCGYEFNVLTIEGTGFTSCDSKSSNSEIMTSCGARAKHGGKPHTIMYSALVEVEMLKKGGKKVL